MQIERILGIDNKACPETGEQAVLAQQQEAKCDRSIRW